MISLEEAFKKFLGRLELTDREQKDVSARHTAIREIVRAGIGVDRDILSGSYKRFTKTKPLKDVDIFFVLKASESAWLQRPPEELLVHTRGLLVPSYGEHAVALGRRSVRVDFGVRPLLDETDEKVISNDVVVAFADCDNYLIPDRTIGDWVRTNPEIHAQLATDAHAAYNQRWKPLVRMIKKWNDYHDRPVKPSFLLEVMALDILNRGFGGHYSLELQTFFATAAARITETWEDPAGLGPPVSDRLASDPIQQLKARQALEAAAENVSTARRLAREGRNGDALKYWREEIFGPLFPLS
ncbi:CBASS oligonucleotide cyclase [Conexibacter sp. DBS9H8]|uniref:CBASS oligonucleotide cyclase n=1 Tax=Conexibacter sp. DBS9H8 TaxID=2937801 RepID=UPI00200D24BD|nr:CBASS oligonucleotide cyclase [Conexibacter sp. DBS9H8]